MNAATGIARMIGRFSFAALIRLTVVTGAR